MEKIEYNTPLVTYATWRKDDGVRALSSSGGMATAVSEAWIREGGIVYGASFVKPFGFQHVRCSKLEELGMLRGSKYVQSSMSGIAKQIDEDVREGRRVLFIGTPCQVAGIAMKYKCKGEQVMTMDIICHGTPKVETLMASLPKEAMAIDFDNVEFRCCGRFQLSFKKEDKVVWTRPLTKDLYMKGFFKALFYRECCYRCQYTRTERVSDMTLGDFWGVDLNVVRTEEFKGISLAIVNTESGRKLMHMVDGEIQKIERPLAEAVAGNKQLSHPMPLTWRHRLYNVLEPKVGFKMACIMSMPDIVLKNLFK